MKYHLRYWSRFDAYPMPTRVASFRKPRANLLGIGICPFVWKSAAFVWLHGMDLAAVVVRKPDASTVWAALENQSAAIRRDFRLTVDEYLLRNAKERGNPCDLHV